MAGCLTHGASPHQEYTPGHHEIPAPATRPAAPRAASSCIASANCRITVVFDRRIALRIRSTMNGSRESLSTSFRTFPITLHPHRTSTDETPTPPPRHPATSRQTPRHTAATGTSPPRALPRPPPPLSGSRANSCRTYVATSTSSPADQPGCITKRRRVFCFAIVEDSRRGTSWRPCGKIGAFALYRFEKGSIPAAMSDLFAAAMRGPSRVRLPDKAPVPFPAGGHRS